jgi:hypothetical protein
MLRRALAGAKIASKEIGLIMSRVVLLTCALLLNVSFAQATAPKQKKSHITPPKTQAPAQQETQATPAPQPPPPPPTPEHGPSSPPEVSFQAGKLTIVARNSTMGDVLTAVKQKTGAAVEMPPVSSERVVGQFGPGEPRDVLAQLLNGSHYDYVLLGSPADPGALNKIVLIARANGPEPAQKQQPGGRPTPNQPLQAVPEVDTDQGAPEEGAVEQPVENPPEEEAQPEQPEQPDQSQQGQPGQPMVKTPEQLLRELQQQQQQQQQQPQPQEQPQNGPPQGQPGQPPQ